MLRRVLGGDSPGAGVRGKIRVSHAGNRTARTEGSARLHGVPELSGALGPRFLRECPGATAQYLFIYLLACLFIFRRCNAGLTSQMARTLSTYNLFFLFF